MSHATDPRCPSWCEVKTPHHRHEGMIHTWHGIDPADARRPITVQTVLYSDNPFVLGVKPVASLGITMIDPSTRTLRQMSAGLSWDDWPQVRDAIDEAHKFVLGRAQ